MAAESGTEGDGAETRRRRPTADGAFPCRLTVVGVDAADVVTAAGGLVFDAVRAGWAVDLYLETADDQRALQILGASGRPLSDGFGCEADWPSAIFLAADLHRRHSGVRSFVRDADRRERTDVAIWGEDCPSDLATGARIEHKLSHAAAAFKRHALDAAGLTPQLTQTEPFRSRGRRPPTVPSPARP